MAGEVYMRRDCIDAVQAFLEKTDALPYVSVGIEGQYISDRNEFRDKSKKEGKTEQDRGTQLCFTFGDGDRDRTVYAFRLKDFTAKENMTAKSTRFAPDGGKPAVIVAKSGAHGSIGSAVDDPDRAAGMYRNTCMAANSLSYGAMFYGYLDHVHMGTKEADAATNVLDDKNRPGGGWAAVRSQLGSPDGLRAMAAWGIMGTALDGQVKPGDPKFGQLVSVASQAMGLDSLYESLEAINDKLAADPDYTPDMSEVMNPDTDTGRVALRGLMCLAAYKQVKDRGGMDLVDSKGAPVVGVTDKNMIMFEKLAYARGDMDGRLKMLSDAETSRSGICPVHCVQKTFAGIGSSEGAKPDPLRNHQQYRLMRSALLGEDPDMPSGAPDISIRLPANEDASKANGRNIMVYSSQFPDDLKEVPLDTFLNAGLKDENTGYGKVLAALPAMKYAAGRVNGVELLGSLAAKQLQKSESGKVDGMCLEMAAFQDRTACKGIMQRKGPAGMTGDGMCAQFQANAKAARDPAPNLIRSIYGAVGRPDFGTGQMALGAQYIADMKTCGVALSEPDVGCGTRAGAAAKAFRGMDLERKAFLDAAENWSSGHPGTMAEAESMFPDMLSAGTYKSLLADYQTEQENDIVRGSMMLNDFIVMTDCYGISDKAGLRDLGADIQSAYDGTLDSGLYRPVNGAEHEAIREIYAKGGAGIWSAFVGADQQGMDEGLLRVIKDANPDSKMIEKVQSCFAKAAADQDTFDEHRNWDLSQKVSAMGRSRYAELAAQHDATVFKTDADRGIDITD